MTDTSKEAVERHLDMDWNHEADLIPTATAVLLAALLAERDALRAKVAVAVRSMDVSATIANGALDPTSREGPLRRDLSRVRDILRATLAQLTADTPREDG